MKHNIFPGGFEEKASARDSAALSALPRRWSHADRGQRQNRL